MPPRAVAKPWPSRGHAPCQRLPPVFVNGLRIDSRGPSNKPCYAFQKPGGCARGQACRFVHDRPFVEPPLRWRESVAVDTSACALPESLRRQRICCMDAGMAEEMARLVCSALGVASVEALAALHELPEGKIAGRARNNEFQKRWKVALQAQGSEWRAQLDRCVRRFVADVVAGNALEAAAHSYSAVCYQAEPSLRLHLPNAKGGIQLHKDADYYHQPNEVNLWLPLTDGVGGSNSLFCETAPGAADYTAFEVGRGSYMRFWGNQCGACDFSLRACMLPPSCMC